MSLQKTTISHHAAAVQRVSEIPQLVIVHVLEQWYTWVYNDGTQILSSHKYSYCMWCKLIPWPLRKRSSAIVPQRSRGLRNTPTCHCSRVRTETYPSIEWWYSYSEITHKSYRNRLVRILKKSEKRYYSDLVATNKSNTKKTWQIMKNIVNKNLSLRWQCNRKQIAHQWEIQWFFL